MAPARCAATAHRSDRAAARALRHRTVRRLSGGAVLVTGASGRRAGDAAVAPLVARSSLCAVVLAAGEGVRLRPLTADIPKALCPIGNVPLLDRAVAMVASLGFAGHQTVAVNAWSHASQIVAHVGGRAHVSVEHGPRPLGSAGGLGALRPWIADRKSTRL